MVWSCGVMLSSGVREIGRFLVSGHGGILSNSRKEYVPCRHTLWAFLVCVLGALAMQTAAKAEDRSLSFYHIHTKESISIVYKRNGQFDQDALQKLNYFMRDWRKNAVVKIDPALFDLIWEMYRELGSQRPIHVICGHRSGATNEMLRTTRGGQAKGSKHITGQAIDLQFPDVNIKQLRNSALIRERGGVGYYPSSGLPFVHVDTGSVRHWPRLPRQELAILFPNGSNKHVPIDGKPLTRADFRVAMARLQEKGGELPIAVRARLNPGYKPTLLASLNGGDVSATVPGAPSAAGPGLPAKAPAPVMAMASFAPTLPRFGGSEAAPKPPSLTRPLVSASAVQTSARANVDDFTRDFINPGKPAAAEEEDVVAEDGYDEDHAEVENQEPFPILPFMSETSVAEMDLTDSQHDVSLAKVHLMFTERREMLETSFRPGLQYAELFWAQRFRGTAVNKDLRMVARDQPLGPVRTAQQSAR